MKDVIYRHLELVWILNFSKSAKIKQMFAIANLRSSKQHHQQPEANTWKWHLWQIAAVTTDEIIAVTTHNNNVRMMTSQERPSLTSSPTVALCLPLTVYIVGESVSTLFSHLLPPNPGGHLFKDRKKIGSLKLFRSCNRKKELNQV